MGLKNVKRFAPAIAVLAVMASPAVAFAATNNATGTATATANISAGSLTLTAPSVATPFSGVTLNGQVQTTKAALGNWTVTDATGTDNGWNVTLSATQFTEVAPSGAPTSFTALTLPTGSMALSGSRTITAASGATAIDATGGPLIKNASSLVDGQTAFKLVDAQSGYGAGTYTINEPISDGLTLTLDPGKTKIDTTNYSGVATPYSSTLTYTVASAP